MANLSENPQWVDGIYQIETSDPVVGGPDGVSNRQAKELASRTSYLKKEQEKTGSDLAIHVAAADPHTQYAPKANPTFTGMPKAPTPATDSNSQQVATTAFVKSVGVTKLAKDQNGADIQDRELFNRNLGSARAYSSSIPIGGSAGLWTTAEFIGWLESQGAFVHAYWVCRGSWSYAHNKIISDTECGQIPLAGSVVEVMGQNDATTIRITTPSTTPAGLSDSANAQFTYVYNGIDYSPGWRRDYNTKNKPTAADVGALPEKAVAQAAAKLATPRTINGVPFDGTANIALTPVNLGLTETVNLAAGALEKAKNGADIPDRELFNRNIGSGRAYSAAIDIGSVEGEWTTANFIDWLRERGAFSHPYWACRGSWTYARNRTITDTGCGHINLTGAVVEVFGNDGNHTLRVTTPSTAPRPDHYENSQFTYVFNGTDYFPGWRRDYNTRHKPTAADVGAVKNAEPTAILASQLPARWSENQEVGSLSLENGKWLSYISVRHRAGVGGDSNQYGFVIFDEDMAMPSNNFYIQKQYAGEWRQPVKLYHSANLIPSTIGAITKVDADSNYVRQGSSGVVYKNDDLAWNSPTGAYVKDNEGDTSLIWHMGLNTGSASAAQFHFNYANGGLRYRSSRDGFGFEKPWARIYSDQDKPTAAEIGALSLNELVGIPMPWPQATAPSGWLKCNGQVFDKNIYPILGKVYPSGILPDLRGEFIRGWDDGRQIDNKRELLTSQQATIVGVGDPNISYAALVSLYNNVDNNLSTIASNLNGEVPVKINDNEVKLLGGAGKFDSVPASQASMYVRPRNIAFNYIVRAA